jgi:hypothetical protein
MTRRMLACTGLAVLGLFFACTSPGDAGDVVSHGSLCNPVQEQAGQVFYNQWGIANLSNAAPLFVACGGATPILATINTVEVEVYDRNPTADAVCTLVLVDIFGSTIGSALNASTSGSQVAAQLLSFSPRMLTHTIVLQCSLPAATSSGVSHLATYRVISTP